MKFPKLAPGARFRWQGELYRKTGPMTAHAEAGGGQRLIPRSALVEALDGSAEGMATGEPGLDIARVQAALRAYEDSLLAYAETLDGPERSALRAQMDVAAKAFRAALRPPSQPS